MLVFWYTMQTPKATIPFGSTKEALLVFFFFFWSFSCLFIFRNYNGIEVFV